MRHLNKLFLIIIIFSFSLFQGCGLKSYYAKLELTELQDSFVITTSESELLIKIPKENIRLVRGANIGGATDHRRYFYLRDENSQFNISGWFEPDYMYPGMKKHFFQLQARLSQNGMPVPTNPTFFRHGNWRVNTYDTPCKATISSPHIQAHLYEQSTWLNLHLSYDCKSEDNGKNLLSFLDRIEIMKK